MRLVTRARIRAIAAIVALAAGAYACAQPVLHKSGGTAFPPRPRGCQVQVVATHPGPGYLELAQITIEGDRSFGAGSYRDPQEFADVVHDRVCAVGGDTLVTEVNGFGIIARGVVLRRVPTPEAPDARGAAPVGTCEPICSPGFLCSAGSCIPQCNPACGDGETCGNDRTCHPSTAR